MCINGELFLRFNRLPFADCVKFSCNACSRPDPRVDIIYSIARQRSNAMLSVITWVLLVCIEFVFVAYIWLNNVSWTTRETLLIFKHLAAMCPVPWQHQIAPDDALKY